jgi:adenosylcobinamide-phosphate guanylyltransferase
MSCFNNFVRPALTERRFLDEIIDKYKKSRKPALTVLVPVETCRKYGVYPTSFYEHEGKTYAISGINIVDWQRILEEQQQEVIIYRKPEAIFNINTPKDLESAKNYLLRSRKTSGINNFVNA